MIYAVLCIYHLGFCVIEFLAEWKFMYEKMIRDKWPIFLVITVYLVIYLC